MREKEYKAIIGRCPLDAGLAEPWGWSAWEVDENGLLCRQVATGRAARLVDAEDAAAQAIAAEKS